MRGIIITAIATATISVAGMTAIVSLPSGAPVEYIPTIEDVSRAQDMIPDPSLETETTSESDSVTDISRKLNLEKLHERSSELENQQEEIKTRLKRLKLK